MSGCFKKPKIPIGLSPFRFIFYRIPHSGIDFRDGITDPSVPFFLFSAHKIARKPTTKKHTLRLKDNHLQAYMRFMQKSGRKPKTIVVPTAKNIRSFQIIRNAILLFLFFQDQKAAIQVYDMRHSRHSTPEHFLFQR